MKIEIDEAQLRKLSNRNTGFSRLPRSIFLLLKEQILSYPELVLWLYCFSNLVDWDSKHTTYQTFKFSNKALAYGLGIDESTVSKNMKSLMRKGFILKLKGGDKKVTNFGFIQYLMRKKRIGVISINHFNHEIPQDKHEEIIDIDEISQEMDKDEYLQSLVDKPKIDQ